MGFSRMAAFMVENNTMNIKEICRRHQINPAHVSEFEQLVDGKTIDEKFGQRLRWVTNYREAYKEILETLSTSLQKQFPPTVETLEPWEPSDGSF